MQIHRKYVIKKPMLTHVKIHHFFHFAVECFSHNGYCQDYSYHVGTVEDCCHNPLQERSYRDSDGVCREW